MDTPHWVAVGRPVSVIVIVEVPLVAEKEVNVIGILMFEPLTVTDPDDGEAIQPLPSA